LFVDVLDISEEVSEEGLESVAQSVLLVPQRHIVTVDRWNLIAELTLSILDDEPFWRRVIREQLGYTEAWQRSIEDLLAYYRVETARNFKLIREDYSSFAYKALSSLVYQASEGVGPGYEYGVLAVMPFPQFFAILNDELMDRLEANPDLQVGRDDLLVWRRVNSLILSPVSQEFKKSFSPLLSYEVPYGLSPNIKSETLEAIIQEARKIAVIPVLSGLNTASTALATRQWVVALEAAAATGAVLIIFLGSVALADVIVRWMRKREIEASK